MFRLCIFFLLLITRAVFSYEPSPYVETTLWNALAPYFLPENHPIKPKLDKIFSSSKRVTQSPKTLSKAGFLETLPRKHSGTIVTKHEKLKGYIIKLFCDDQNLDETKPLLDRIFGSLRTQQSIILHHYQDMLTVPKKWLYPLPPSPSPAPGSFRKNFILVVEDMKLVSKESNINFWQGVTMTPKRLDAIYTVIQEVGLIDSIYTFNLPFTKGGQMSFIDTQLYHMWPVDFNRLTKYLSPKMQIYWSKMIIEGGPK